jgi:hypothetical protein
MRKSYNKGKNNGQYTTGYTTYQHYCKDCNKEIKYSSTYCHKCATKGKRYYNYKGELPHCVDCGKQVSKRNIVRCRKCSNIFSGHNRKKLHLCVDCNISISSVSLRCRKCSGKVRSIILKKYYSIPENNNNYINGLHRKPYPSEFNDSLKETIRKRDNYTCQNCNMTEEEHIIVTGVVLTVHHIDYNKQNCKDSNLITVCLQCNIRANYNRSYWKQYYKEKICSHV